MYVFKSTLSHPGFKFISLVENHYSYPAQKVGGAWLVSLSSPQPLRCPQTVQLGGGEKWADAAAGVEPGLGERGLCFRYLGFQREVSPLPPASAFLRFCGVCCTCLTMVGLVSSFIQQIFTELLNPRAGLSTVSLPFPEPQFSSSERCGGSSLLFSCHQSSGKIW